MGSFGLCGVDGFTRVFTRGLWVHPGSLGSFQCAHEVVGFNFGRWVHSGAPWVSFRVAFGYALGVVGFILGHWVHSVVAPWWLFGSSWVVEFTRERPVGRWFHAGRWVHPLWHSGTPWRSFGVGGFTRVRSSVVVGFTRVRPGERWVYPGSLGSLRCALGIVVFIPGLVHSMRVVGFIRGRWVHSGAPW